MGVNIPLLLTFVVVLCVILPASSGSGVYAFGAGNIPSFAYLEGRAFRHGDIEDILAELLKSGGGGVLAILGRHKFGGLDIKRVYFGNWLRDYSQAVDIAALKKLPLQTILNLCMALGFLANGYATGEFEVTPERLGCYLPTEHIDNPKGYGEGEDARKYHPGLRGPVDPRELEVDPNTGMKNYIANEHGGWDTSRALVRRRIEECINLGRKYRQSNQKADLYESFRLLGTALHTLEDFPAHSNFCELALVSMGHHQVFCHVGDSVRIRTHAGKNVAPLVTGTFGGDDFLHSLLGEASDHLSEASVSDLHHEMDKAKQKSRARSGPGGNGKSEFSILSELLGQLPGSEGQEMTRDMANIERLRAAPGQPGGKKPEEMTPQELHAVLWQVLSFRDSVVKKIEKTIEKIPGLGPLIESLMESITVFIFTTLEPYLKPLLKSASGALMQGSAEVINSHDQFEVFNKPHASDPTHSFLSKDHFNLILNEPAGNLAIIIVRHSVKLVVEAWETKNLNMKQTTDQILECLFHPDYYNRNSAVQREMIEYMGKWLAGYGNKQNEIISRLSKESVRNHNNIRLPGVHGGAPAHGVGTQATSSTATGAAGAVQNKISGYINQIPGAQAAGQFMNFPAPGGGGGHHRDADAPQAPYAPGHTHRPSQEGVPPPPPPSGEAASFYGGGGAAPSVPSYGAPTAPSYGSPTPSYGSPTPSYGAPAAPPGGAYGSPQPQWNSYGGPSPAYSPPAGPGPSSYAPPGGPPSFPSSAPSYGGGYGQPAPGGYGYTPPGGPPGFPPPGGPPGGFPSPGEYGGAPPYGGPPAFPSFPGGPGGYQPPPAPGSGYPGQYGH